MSDNQLPPITCQQCQCTADIEFSELYLELPEVHKFAAKEMGWFIDGKSCLCKMCFVKNYNVWRLPTIKELKSLLWENPISNPEGDFEGVDENFDPLDFDFDTDKFFTCPDGQEAYRLAFPDSELVFISSSQTKQSILGSTDTIDFKRGRQNWTNKERRVHIRLVRSKQADSSWNWGDPIEKRYLVSDCGEFVTDNRTGLQWKRQPEDERYSWISAQEAFPTIETIEEKIKKIND